MEIAALVVSVVALLVAIWSAWSSYRSEGHAKRSADAAERQVALGEAEAARYDIPWTLEHHNGDMYQLTNTNEAEACHDVEVTGEVIVQDVPTETLLGPREAIKIFALRSMGTNDDTVTVRWNRPPETGDEERHTWRHPLPTRPPRRK